MQVILALLGRAETLSVTIACSAWQVNALARWPILQGLRGNPQTRFRSVDFHPRWTVDRRYYQDDRMLTWHEELKPLDLASFDLVLSDNLVEPLLYQPRTVLMGSFLWHDIYRIQFPDEPVVRKYCESCDDLLGSRKPAMIVNRYFVMPGVRERVRLIEVGMLPPVVKGSVKRSAAVPGVLFTGGASSTGATLVRSFLEAVLEKRVMPDCPRVFVERRMAEDLTASGEWSAFDYDEDDFGQINAVVARPGMGAVADCIGTATPMFCVHEANPEMDHNARTLERLGLGRRLSSPGGCLSEICAYFADRQALDAYQQRSAAIDKDGLEQTVQSLVPSLS